MQNINSAIVWYQHKIGDNDNTEKEKHIKNINNIPKKLAKVKSELIDVDLVRGSKLSKIKTKHGWITISKNAILHLIFMPFYYKWWVKQTTQWFSRCLAILYLLQIFVCFVFILDNTESTSHDSLSIVHLLSPIILMLFLSISHSCIIATSAANHPLKFSHDRLKQNKSLKKAFRKSQKKRCIPQRFNVNKDILKENEKLVAFNIQKSNDSLTSDLLNGKEESDEEKRPAEVLLKCDSKTCFLSQKMDNVNFDNVGAIECKCKEDLVDTKNNDNSIQNTKAMLDLPPLSRNGLRQRKNLKQKIEKANKENGNTSSDSSCESNTDIKKQTLLQTPEVFKRKQPFHKGIRRRPSTDNEHQVRYNLIDQTTTTDPQSDIDWPASINEISTSTDSCNSETDVKLNSTELMEFEDRQSLITTTVIDKIGCCLWENGEWQKCDLTAIDIGEHITDKVDSDNNTNTSDYLAVGMFFSICLSCLPLFFRIYMFWKKFLWQNGYIAFLTSIKLIFGTEWKSFLIITNGIFQRLFFSGTFFFLLSVAERTFKQRLLDAKYFCYLTSSRRAKQHHLPHMRLNKVKNIKCWLTIRSFLKRRGPQASVDTIVSGAFLLAIALVSIFCVRLLSGSDGFMLNMTNWEITFWCCALSVFLLRFITIASKINQKYRNFSLLVTEQINLYLHMEQKPDKKNELMLANNVLKLAESLLKELESPFKISGFAASPLLYNITKVVILSALSGILSDQFGFKAKLHRIKLS